MSIVEVELQQATVEITEDSGRVVVVEVGLMGPQGPPGTLIEAAEDGVIVSTPLRELNFTEGFDLVETSPRHVDIALDLSESPELQAVIDTEHAHEIDVVGAHNASAIAADPFGTIVSADVQSQLEEIEAEIGTAVAGAHPNLAVHDAMGLATDVELVAAVNAAISAVIAGAPGALDTLNELAAALGDDANFAATITSALALKLAGGTPGLTLGTTDAPGTAVVGVRTDATIAAFDGTDPSTIAFGDAPAVGAVAKAARRDHGHGMPALAGFGAETRAAHADHGHAFRLMQRRRYASSAPGTSAELSLVPNAGDLLVAVFTHRGDPDDVTIPSGWSLAASQAGTSPLSLMVFYKVAAAALEETCSVTWTGSANACLELTEWAGVATDPVADLEALIALVEEASAALAISDPTLSAQLAADADILRQAEEEFGDQAGYIRILERFLPEGSDLSLVSQESALDLALSDAIASSTSDAAPSGTPSEDGELLIAAVAARDSVAWSETWDNGFDPSSALASDSSSNDVSLATAYSIIDHPRASYAPGTSWTPAAVADSVLVSFRSAPPRSAAGTGGGGETSFAEPTIALGLAASEGSADTAVRSDATIAAFDTTVPSTQAFGDSAAIGSAAFAARRDHKHAMPSAPSERAAASTTPAAVGTAAVGTGTTDARSDHVHATGAGTPSTQAFGDSAAVGTGPAAAMTDHKHGMPAAPSERAASSSTPAAVGTAAVGTGTTDARADHVHAASGDTPSTQAFGDTASAGASAKAAQSDHKHAMPSLATNTITLSTAAGGGTAVSAARSDAVIAAFDTTNPSTQAFGDAAATGSVAFAARRDHKHAMPSERAASSTTPAAVGTAAVGTGTTDARSDHVHATGAGTPSTQASGDAASTGTGPAAAMTDHKHGMPDIYIPVTFAKTGVLTTGAGVLRWYNDTGRTLTIAKIRASVDTAPTGAAILVDVDIDGTTIWATQGNRVTVAISAFTGTQTSFDTTTIADGHYLTADIDQIGSTIAGSNLTVTIWLKG